MIKLIIFSTLAVNGEPQIVEGALFNEYDYEYVIEARRRGGKGNKGRRRGGGGLRQDGKEREKYNGTDVSRMVI